MKRELCKNVKLSIFELVLRLSLPAVMNNGL